MTGAELAQAMAELHLSPTDIATLYGTDQRRVMKWIDGLEDIPHPIRVILALLRLPGNMEVAFDTTNQVLVVNGRDSERRQCHDRRASDCANGGNDGGVRRDSLAVEGRH
jgi:hypothetical protein